jgi:hypothetical protein
MSFFHNLTLSPSLTFWLGFLSGILTAWIFSRLRIYAPASIRALRKKLGGVRENLSVSSEVRLRKDVYRFAQKQHIASDLFSLDEISITPKVLTPLTQAPQCIEIPPSDSVSLAVPYTPDWPEMAAAYNASTMTLIEALQGGANVILAGHPGSGKTVALAWLASVMARNAPGLGILEGVLPLYIQATELLHLLHLIEDDKKNVDFSKNEDITQTVRQPLNKVAISDDPLDILVKTISSYTSPITTTRLTSIINPALEKQRAILLIDRLDELPPHEAIAITAFIISIRQKYPKLRFVVAASYENLAGLPAIGFSLLGVAAWNDYDRATFLARWSRVWMKWIDPLDNNSSKKINTQFLSSWLLINNTPLKPLEFMLKIWADQVLSKHISND